MSVSYQYRGCSAEINLVLGSLYSFRGGRPTKKIKQRLWSPSPPADDEEDKCPKCQTTMLGPRAFNQIQLNCQPALTGRLEIKVVGF